MARTPAPYGEGRPVLGVDECRDPLAGSPRQSRAAARFLALHAVATPPSADLSARQHPWEAGVIQSRRGRIGQARTGPGGPGQDRVGPGRTGWARGKRAQKDGGGAQ
ncbi:hypothetical protein GCM10009665_74170 [Kitasatospora nipponensis]|uniref:Transposase IS701-like DDE domain-containing protein n=1 Tax=Kitasatospora nipponensis TaxID=258049 RepID=A0ABN1T791_9ACTN